MRNFVKVLLLGTVLVNVPSFAKLVNVNAKNFDQIDLETHQVYKNYKLVGELTSEGNLIKTDGSIVFRSGTDAQWDAIKSRYGFSSKTSAPVTDLYVSNDGMYYTNSNMSANKGTPGMTKQEARARFGATAVEKAAPAIPDFSSVTTPTSASAPSADPSRAVATAGSVGGIVFNGTTMYEGSDGLYYHDPANAAASPGTGMTYNEANARYSAGKLDYIDRNGERIFVVAKASPAATPAAVTYASTTLTQDNIKTVLGSHLVNAANEKGGADLAPVKATSVMGVTVERTMTGPTQYSYKVTSDGSELGNKTVNALNASAAYGKSMGDLNALKNERRDLNARVEALKNAIRNQKEEQAAATQKEIDDTNQKIANKNKEIDAKVADATQKRDARIAAAQDLAKTTQQNRLNATMALSRDVDSAITSTGYTTADFSNLALALKSETSNDQNLANAIIKDYNTKFNESIPEGTTIEQLSQLAATKAEGSDKRNFLEAGTSMAQDGKLETDRNNLAAAVAADDIAKAELDEANGSAVPSSEDPEVNEETPSKKAMGANLFDAVRTALMVLTPMLAETHLSLKDDINIKAGDIGEAVGAVDSTALGPDVGDDATRPTTVALAAGDVQKLLQQATVDTSLLSENVKFDEADPEKKVTPLDVSTGALSKTSGQTGSYRNEVTTSDNKDGDKDADEDTGPSAEDILNDKIAEEIKRRRAELMKQYVNASIQIAEGMNAISKDFASRAKTLSTFAKGIQTESAGYGLAQDVGRYVLFETLRGLALSSAQMGVQASRLLFEQEVEYGKKDN